MKNSEKYKDNIGIHQINNNSKVLHIKHNLLFKTIFSKSID